MLVLGESIETWHCTGGRRAQALARQECRYPHHGREPEFLAGGPLDAPEVLPAGGSNSTTTQDGLTGGALPAMTYCFRPGCAPWSLKGDPA